MEKGTFTPLVYSTFGGCGPQARRYHKRLAELISRKRNEEYHHVINHIRMKIRFSLLRSVLVAVRGERGKRPGKVQPLSSVAFNMIPDAMSYESFLTIFIFYTKSFIFYITFYQINLYIFIQFTSPWWRGNHVAIFFNHLETGNNMFLLCI